MWSKVVLGAAIVCAAAGCSSSGDKFAPVSGKVTLNGKPVRNATISFQPVAPEGSMKAGPGSSGKTNENGEYTLALSTGGTGAWVGKHRVIITSLAEQTGSGDERPPRGGWPLKDAIPEKYNAKTTLTFEVTAAGTGSADFALTSP
jgi:hypothetical protein